MISIHTAVRLVFRNIDLNSLTLFDSDRYEKIRAFAKIHILEPGIIGAAEGAKLFVADQLLFQLLSLKAFSKLSTLGCNPDKAAKYDKLVSEHFWTVVLLGPIKEEIIFRVIIQSTFKCGVDRIFPPRGVPLPPDKINRASLVSIFACAILFGVCHRNSGHGIVHVFLATVSGVVYGALRQKHNLIASIAAHATCNALTII